MDKLTKEEYLNGAISYIDSLSEEQYKDFGSLLDFTILNGDYNFETKVLALDSEQILKERFFSKHWIPAVMEVILNQEQVLDQVKHALSVMDDSPAYKDLDRKSYEASDNLIPIWSEFESKFPIIQDIPYANHVDGEDNPKPEFDEIFAGRLMAIISFGYLTYRNDALWYQIRNRKYKELFVVLGKF